MVCTLSTLEGKGIFIDGVELVSYIYIGGDFSVVHNSFLYLYWEVLCRFSANHK